MVRVQNVTPLREDSLTLETFRAQGHKSKRNSAAATDAAVVVAIHELFTQRQGT